MTTGGVLDQYCKVNKPGARLAGQCFRKKGSNPPMCGLHNVPHIRKQLPDEMIAAGYKAFTFLACPVSGEVLSEQ
jgi:hypothetical protein